MCFQLFLQENLPFKLDLLPKNSFLVGGCVRDILLKRQAKNLDLDFVFVENPFKFAKQIAKDYQGGFVILDQERNIFRVVFKKVTLDFAQMEGDSLMKDLHRRDFTINAIAYSPFNDELIDPLKGKQDLEKKLIKMISANNLKDDPLRLLRGYRQANQLNFNIELNTRLTIKKLAPLLSKIAAERIHTELNYLLVTPKGSQWLKEAYHDGLLSVLFKNITLEKVERLTKIDTSAKWMAENWQKIEQKTESWYYLAKLASLVSENAEIAEQELINLKCSRVEIRSIKIILQYLPQLLNINSSMNLREQYFFFLKVGDVFLLIAILAISLDFQLRRITPLIDSYLDINDPIAHPQPLITGNDLINELQISPSPKIGELLTEIQIAYIEGKITTKKEALEWAKKLINS